MIKRVFWIALYTGTAQILSLFTISYVLLNLGEIASGYIGLIDSTILIIASVVSFGIQLSVNRNVATQKNWRSNYILAQGARLSLSLLVILFGIGSFLLNWDITKWIYFVAPLIALNGDYSLYGNAKPVDAARLSMIRVGLPNLAVLVGSQFIGMDAIYLYVIFAGVGILNSGLWASRINEVPYMFEPSKTFHKFYFKYLKVGIYQLTSAMLVIGILAISKGFYAIATLGLVYPVLKYFEVFKGVLRIIVQAFFKELTLEGTNLRIDKAGILIGGGIAIPAFIYPGTVLNFLYGDTYLGIELILPLFGVAILIASLKPSADVQILLKKKDDINLYTYLTAFTLTYGIVIAMSYTNHALYGIPTGLIVGESCLLIGLGVNLGGLAFFKERLVFALRLLPILVIALALRLLFSETMLTFGISVALYGFYTFFMYRRLLFDSSFIIRN